MKHIKPWSIRFLTVVALLAVCFATFDIRIYYGNNMYPSIRDGDMVFAYKLSAPNQDDIVLYQSEDGQMKLGRVVALAGSTVDISDNKTITVNGSDTTEDAFYPTDKGQQSYPYIVPADSYFILNDYRSDIGDSRTYAAISSKNIKGVVSFVVRRRDF